MTGLNMLTLIDILVYKKNDRHFIKENIDSGLICTSFIASKLQLFDVFTKGVQNPTFNSMVSKLGMKDVFELA